MRFESVASVRAMGVDCIHVFSARSILDSTVSCDVTERYSPIARSNMAAFLSSKLQQVAVNLSFEQEAFLRACHSEKQSFGFLKKDPRNQVLFN